MRRQNYKKLKIYPFTSLTYSYTQRELATLRSALPLGVLAIPLSGNSPHHSVERITTPMLVIHGDRDYRVPIGEGLRLWWELLSASGLPAGEDGTSPHRFLYFPNENHWVLSPQHAKVWYEVVLGFVDEHVRGIRAVLPDTLG